MGYPSPLPSRGPLSDGGAGPVVSGHWWGTERHTVCLSLAGGPVSLFFKLLNSIGQQMRSAHSPHPHCRDCRVLAERMVRMSSLGAWRRGAIMIANQPPSHIPSGACTGPSPFHRPPRLPHPLPAQLGLRLPAQPLSLAPPGHWSCRGPRAGAGVRDRAGASLFRNHSACIGFID